MMKFLATTFATMAAASPFTDSMAGKLMSKNGDFDAKQLEGKTVLIYFSAHWCPPCRGFTPKLAEFYNTATKEGKQIEVIFASSDQDEGSFNEYYSEMPWVALKYSEKSTKDDLSQKHGIQGIPMLVVVKPDGSTEANDGRARVSGGDIAAFDSCSTH